jgi:hypothetical protein
MNSPRKSFPWKTIMMATGFSGAGGSGVAILGHRNKRGETQFVAKAKQPLQRPRNYRPQLEGAQRSPWDRALYQSRIE